MSVSLNTRAVAHAKELIEAGRVVHDEHSDWGDAAPDSKEENTYLEKHGYGEYSKWFLGIDSDESEHTKSRYSFPIGNFSKILRGGVIAAEDRAAQYDHDDIAAAAKRLLALIDES